MNSELKKQLAEVVLLSPPFLHLTYAVPDPFQEEIKIGHRVKIPLGRRRVSGIVVKFLDHTDLLDIKPIEDILDPYPALPLDLVWLTQWIAEYYLCAWGEVLRIALPPGSSGETKLLITRVKETIPEALSLSQTEKEIWDLLPLQKSIALSSLERKLRHSRIHYGLHRLEKKGLIQLEYALKEKQAIKKEKWISLRKKPTGEILDSFKKRAPQQAQVLSLLLESGGKARRSELNVDSQVLNKLKASGWIEMWEEELVRDAYPELEIPYNTAFPLTEAQKKAVEEIEKPLSKGIFKVFLLHGVTGSGKTQVYIECIRKCLALGKTALVLVPEISLTPQAVARYRSAFEEEVAVLHSRMSRGERFDSWRRIREGKAKIALGPRSAVFAPLENLGLIVVDEEHETSYKQNDPAPRYHARDTAVMRGKFNQCPIILGSATPSLESYANVQMGKYTLCRLSERIDRLPLPTVIHVNQKETIPSGIFSPYLIQAIQERLEKGEQVILLHNRRGYAPWIRCNSCGAVETCPHCAISLTFHLKEDQLKCHYCGFQKRPVDICTACGGTNVQYRGIGTERIEKELQTLFPKIRIFRMDLDTLRKKGMHIRLIQDFAQGKAQILLGTQLVAKGHDFPRVTLVGIISADTGLFFPDFRSGERTFQLLTQAEGRAGRKDQKGEVIVQTSCPEHPVLQFSKNHDYESFFHWEMKQREELGYPPFGRLALVGFKSPSQLHVEKAAYAFLSYIPKEKGLEILGPAPAFLSKLKREYRYQILLRTRKKEDPGGIRLHNAVRKAMGAYGSISPYPDVRVSVDIDPMDLL